MKEKSFFCGIATALITPFKEGAIDEKAFRALVRDQIAAGVHGLVVCGTTGEASTLTDKEKDTLLTAALEETAGALPVIMGTGANDTARAVAATKRAKALGADGALVVTPYYNKGTGEGLRAHFGKVAEEGGLPLILYNVPSRTGVDLSLRDYEVLIEHPCITGIKEASPDVEKLASLCLLAEGRARIYTGNDTLLLPALAVGAQGCISVVSNILPKNTAEVFHLWQKSKAVEAQLLFQRIFPLCKALFRETNPAPVKYLAGLLGYGDGSLRLPLAHVTEETEETLLSAFAPWQDTGGYL